MFAKTKFELAVISKVTEMRVKRGLSQHDIAAILETSHGFIGQVETPTHTSKYNLNHLNKLAYAMECKLSDLIPDEPVREADWDE